MRLLVAAALALAMSFPAMSAECKATMAAVIAALESEKITYQVIAPDKLLEFAQKTESRSGVKPEDVTGALMADFGSAVVFGVETKDGCFSPSPIELMAVGPKA